MRKTRKKSKLVVWDYDRFQKRLPWLSEELPFVIVTNKKKRTKMRAGRKISVTELKKKKYLLRRDIPLLVRATKQIGSRNLESILKHQDQLSSFKHILNNLKRTKLRYQKGAEETAKIQHTRFLLKNFTSFFAELTKTRITTKQNRYFFEINKSKEEYSGLWLGLWDASSTGTSLVATIHLDIAISPKNKPILVIGNFQGQTKHEPTLNKFKQALLDSEKVKEKTTILDFMLGKMLSSAPKKAEVKALNPKIILKLVADYPEGFVAIVRNELALKRGVKDEEVPLKEAGEEAKRIRAHIYGMHRSAFLNHGFHPQQNPPPKGTSKKNRRKAEPRFWVLQR